MVSNKPCHSWVGGLALATLAVLTGCGGGRSGPPASPGSSLCAPLPTTDGHEPPCNPFLGSSVWSSPHRGSYAQGSSPLPGPISAEGLEYRRTRGIFESPTIYSISEPYPDGGRTIWFSSVSIPQAYSVYKLDYDSLEVLGHTDIRDEGGSPSPVSTTSGVYNLLMRGNRLVALRERSIGIYGDIEPGRRQSDIALLQRFDPPASAFCRDSDRIVGLTLLYGGEIAYATSNGVVGVLPSDPEQMNAAQLRTWSINGEACNDATIEDEDLEQVTNSISADEDGGIYVVSTRALYQFRYSAGQLSQGWRTEYRSGGGSGGTTLSSGSGSTPDVVGTHPGDDQLVVITDGQRLMHLVMMWRNEIPEDWPGIAPGRDRRIACEFPVTFGDPSATRSISEQSVLTRGYAAVVVNNAMALDPLLALLPDTGLNQILALLGQLPWNQPRGVERIDWDPATRTCRSVWSNRRASIPNGVPTLSVASGMVYGISAVNGVWGLLGLDFATGEQRFFARSTALPTDNSFFAATVVGPEGRVLTGTVTGLGAFVPKSP